MKKLVIAVSLLSMSTIATAADNGFYVGLQAGRVDSHYDNQNFGINFPTTAGFNVQSLGQTAPAVDSSDLGGRIFMGYQYDPYMATELGYTYIPSVDLLDAGTTAGNPNGTSVNLDEQAGDISQKFMLPISDSGVDLYARLGIAYINTSEQIDIASTSFSQSQSADAFRPTYGAGVSYDFNNAFAADISWTRIQGNDNIQNVDMAAVGVAYHFGD